jgi:hypothetical protein
MGFMPMTLTAVHGVLEEQAGVASALLNTAQQIGAALGLAVLATISTSAANERLPDAARVLQEGLASNDAGVVATASAALSHGYTMGFFAGAGMLLIAAVVVIAAVTTRRTQGAAAPGVGE